MTNAVDESLPLMHALIDRYSADRGNLERKFPLQLSPDRFRRFEEFNSIWRRSLDEVAFDSLDLHGRIDSLLFRNHLNYEQRALRHEMQRQERIADLIPFADTIIQLDDARRRMEPLDPKEAASALANLVRAIESARESIEKELASAPASAGRAVFPPTLANRAARAVGRLRRALHDWHEFHHGYDPIFTWWASEPFEKADQALESYATFLREKLAGADDEDTIIGDPIGREALLTELEHEMIPYTPEELIDIAEREYEWCLSEMRRAARDLGFADDWHAALEHVKNQHVQPGDQPRLVKELALEAIEFLEERDLVTIPELCRETWRMTMMSPRQQMISPYFLGGEVIMIAFPTHEMAHEDKLMSMRGNNIHFARATVHHELIPGHHLQGFMTERYRRYRGLFGTPFWGEGWALYWEMRLWDLGFPRSAEDRVGMLFWRMHRCARIVFSLNFHLEKMTAQEAIDYLVEHVGHERNNAEAEVRRSVSGDYSPLYQAAYMVGGLQFRALHGELVQSGRKTEREFHDAILRLNSIPVEMVRATLLQIDLPRDYSSQWRFYSANERDHN